MAKINTYRIQPAYEPNGEGNGWEDCTDDLATCFYVETEDGEDEMGTIWSAVEGCDTRAGAARWIADHAA